WTVATETVLGTNYITVLYHVVSGVLTNFDAYRGAVSGTTITWDGPHLISQASGGNQAVAVNAAVDTNNNLFAVFRFIEGSTFHYAIFKSTDGGSGWTTSLSDFNSGSTFRIETTLTKLSSGNMLYVYANYTGTSFIYRV